MGGACRTLGREKHTGFCWGNLRERDHMVDTGVDGKVISKWILWKWNGEGGFMDCIDLAQKRDSWQALVNAVVNLRF